MSSKCDPCPGPITRRNSESVGPATHSLGPHSLRCGCTVHACACIVPGRSQNALFSNRPQTPQFDSPWTKRLWNLKYRCFGGAQRWLVIIGLCFCYWQITPSLFWRLLGAPSGGLASTCPVRSFFHTFELVTDGCSFLTANPGTCCAALSARRDLLITLADQIMISSPCIQSREEGSSLCRAFLP